ncbi:MAG: hypothetical protein RR913_02935 [Oscillospiraceae bacterium]
MENLGISKNPHRAELMEMAKAILSELGGGTRVLGFAPEFDVTAAGKARGFDGEGNAQSGLLSAFDNPFGAERRRGVFGGEPENVLSSEEQERDFVPRFKRRDFLKERLSGNYRRGLEFKAESGEGERAGDFAEAETLLQTGLGAFPEKLSELFCRDARRYDGAFERF